MLADSKGVWLALGSNPRDRWCPDRTRAIMLPPGLLRMAAPGGSTRGRGIPYPQPLPRARWRGDGRRGYGGQGRAVGASDHPVREPLAHPQVTSGHGVKEAGARASRRRAILLAPAAEPCASDGVD